MFWIGFGIAIAGFFLGTGISELGEHIKIGLKRMDLYVNFHKEMEETKETKDESTE